MKFSSAIFIAGLFGLASTAPVQHKRDLVYVTNIMTETDMSFVTQTIWVNPASATAASAAAVSTVVPSAESAAPIVTSQATPQNSIVVPRPSISAPAAAPAPSTTEVLSVIPAPAPSTMVTSTAAPAPAATQAPVQTSAAAPAPAPSASSAPASSGNANTDSLGTKVTGEMTWYDVGLGACGITNVASDHIVAVSQTLYDSTIPGGNPNAATVCGKTINISYNGVTVPAKVMDRCVACTDTHIDLSEGLFQMFGSTDAGVLSGATWTWE